MNTPLTQTLLLLLLSTARGSQGTTEITEDNYALAETQTIFSNYTARIRDIYKDLSPTGTGIFLHNTQAVDPYDKTVVRPNFDTQYSICVLDLTTPATLTVPKTDRTDRYQSVWMITEDAWNPTYYLNADVEKQYVITEENMGSKYVLALARTQVNMRLKKDQKLAIKTQLGLKIDQEDPGSYIQSDLWDEDIMINTWRAYYAEYGKNNSITSAQMFGPDDGTISTVNHNVGVATGWGGLTPERAVYLNYNARITGPFTLTLTDVPVRAFWSITVYDADGFVNNPDYEYNVNSAFADGSDGSVTKNIDGSYVINFVDTKTYSQVDKPNKMGSYSTWNFILRLYEPDQTIVDGTWVQPELVKVLCRADARRSECKKDGCKFYKSIKGKKKTKCGSFPNRPSTTKAICESIERQDHCIETGFCKWNTNEGCQVVRCKKLKPDECKESSVCLYRNSRCVKKPSSPPPTRPCCPAEYTGLRPYGGCQKFFYCVGGVVTGSLNTCPEGTLFDANIQVCNYEDQVECNDEESCDRRRLRG